MTDRTTPRPPVDVSPPVEESPPGDNDRGQYVGILPANPTVSADATCPQCLGNGKTATGARCLDCKPHAVYIDKARPLSADALAKAIARMDLLRAAANATVTRSARSRQWERARNGYRNGSWERVNMSDIRRTLATPPPGVMRGKWCGEWAAAVDDDWEDLAPGGGGIMMRYQPCDDCHAVCNADDLYAVSEPLNGAVCGPCRLARRVAVGARRLARPVAAGTRRARGPLP